MLISNVNPNRNWKTINWMVLVLCEKFVVEFRYVLSWDTWMTWREKSIGKLYRFVLQSTKKNPKKLRWWRYTISNGSHFPPPGLSTIRAITVRIAITACKRCNSTNNSAIPPSVQAVHPTVFQPSLLFDNGHKQAPSLPRKRKRTRGWFCLFLIDGGGEAWQSL